MANAAGTDKSICVAGTGVQIGTAPQLNMTYSWSPAAGLSNPNISNPIANPGNTTIYTLTATSNTNLLQNGDFAAGNVNTGSAYTFLPNAPITTAMSGQYRICTNPSVYNPMWCVTPGNDNMMVVDGAANPRNIPVVWSQTIPVQAGQDYSWSLTAISENNTFNNNTGIPQISVSLNGTPLANTILPFNNCRGFNFFGSFPSGTITNANIQLFDLNTVAIGNDFAIDNITLKCSNKSTVKVFVGTANTLISPTGPIEVWWPLDAPPTITLTSPNATGNQWYYNNSPISGATGQNLNYHGYASGNYSVRNSGCISNNVAVTYKNYGYGNYGEDPYTWGAKIHPTATSSFFCLNTTTNPIKEFDLGTAANYSWNILGGSPVDFFITPGSTSLHSYQAQLTIGTNPNRLAYLEGIADLNGSQKIIDYWITCSPADATWSTCTSLPLTLAVPGATDFDVEKYTVGANASFIYPNPSTPPPMVIFSQNNTVFTIPGRSPLTAPIKVQFSGSSSFTKDFSYNGTYGGCYHEKLNITSLNCKVVQNPAKPNVISIYPNPVTNFTTISSNEETILSIEISDSYGRVLKTISGNSSNKTSIDLSGLKPGAYNCLIRTKNNIETQKIIIKH